MAAWVLAGA